MPQTQNQEARGQQSWATASLPTQLTGGAERVSAPQTSPGGPQPAGPTCHHTSGPGQLRLPMTGQILCTAGHAHPTERRSTGQGGRSHGGGERSPPRPPAGRSSTLVHTCDRATPTRSDSLPEERVFSEQHRVFCFSPRVAVSHTRLFTPMRSSEVKLKCHPRPRALLGEPHAAILDGPDGPPLILGDACCCVLATPPCLPAPQPPRSSATPRAGGAP